MSQTKAQLLEPTGVFTLTNQLVGVGATFSGNVSIAGTLTKQDVTNVDSVGVITARQGVVVPDGEGYKFGDGSYRIEGKDDGANARIGFVAGGSERVRITSVGEVLTGHDTALLAGGTKTQQQLVGTNFATSGSALFRFDTGTSGPTLSLAHSKNATKGSHTSLIEDDELGKIRFYGSDGTDFNNYGADIRAIVDGTPGADDMPGALIFGTTPDGAASPTERIRITKEGYVQIKYAGSATTGSAPLYVGVTGKSNITYGGGNADTACLRIEDEGSTDSYYHGIEFRTKNSGDARIYAQDMGSDAVDLVFATDNTGIVERLRITSAGKIGIGDDAPDALLSVKGDSNADSNPSIRLKDGTDTRETWISNVSGDLYLASGGTDNVYHSRIRVMDGSAIHFDTANGLRATINANGVSDAKGNLRDIPINFHNAGTYTLVAADAGKVVSEATMGSNITVPASVFSGGNAVTIMNHTGNNITLTQGSGVTMYNAADSSTGNRTLAARGLCTIFYREHNVAYISGAGLS